MDDAFLEEARKHVSYDPDTGKLSRITNKGFKPEGTEPGHKSMSGYRRIVINGKRVSVHRLVYYMYHGRLDKTKVIDHINGIRDDNRICNLREASHSQNANSYTKPGSSGYRGVCLNKSKKNPYSAHIRVNNKRKWIGHFPTAEEAARAYNKAAKEAWGEFAILNFKEESDEDE